MPPGARPGSDAFPVDLDALALLRGDRLPRGRNGGGQRREKDGGENFRGHAGTPWVHFPTHRFFDGLSAEYFRCRLKLGRGGGVERAEPCLRDAFPLT